MMVGMYELTISKSNVVPMPTSVSRKTTASLLGTFLTLIVIVFDAAGRTTSMSLTTMSCSERLMILT